MNLLLNRKKGAVLLQTLIMSVLLSMIAVMIIKWSMGRYVLVNRVMKSAAGTVNAQGYAVKNQMTLNTPPDASGSMGKGTMDSKQISFTRPDPANAPTKYVTTIVND